MTVLWLLAACAATGDSADDTLACPSDRELTWNNFGHGFVATYCLGCHSVENTDHRYGAPEGSNFDTEAEFVDQADRVRVRVLDQQTMPVGGGVYQDDLTELARYLDCLGV